MEVHKEMMAGSLGDHTLIETVHPLVCTVHKVYLHALDAPLLIGGKKVEMLLYGQPRQPQDNAHAAALSVGNEFLQAQVGLAVERIAGVDGPSFIEQDVFKAIFGSKVNEMRISVVIIAGLEMNIRTIGNCTIPPLP